MTSSASQYGDSELRRIQATAILPLSFFALSLSGLAAVVGFIDEGGSSGVVEAIVALFVIVNLFSYLYFGKLTVATHVLVLIIGAFLSAGLYTGSADRFGEYWPMLMPLFASLLLPRKSAVWMVGAFVLSCIPAVMLAADGSQSYSQADIFGIITMTVVITGVLLIYRMSILAPKSKGSKMMNASHVSSRPAIAPPPPVDTGAEVKAAAEAQITEALEKLEENNEELERVTAIDEATISSIGEAVLIVDKDGMVIRANPSSGRVLGINQEDIIGGQIVDKLSFAALKDESQALPREQIAIYQSIAHRSINEERYKATKPDGMAVYVQMTASPLVVSGEVYGAVVVVRDIGQEVSVDRAKTEFVSIASHQLRTPLSTINWYLEMVLGGDFGPVNDEQKEFIQEAYGASKRMGDLINALLNASRLDVGVVAIEPDDNVDIRVVLKGVVTDLEAKLAAKQIMLKQKIGDAVQPMRLDTRIMEIIFLNLLTNAVKYSPSGSEVIVSGDIEGDDFVIRVEDHGYGIPTSDQEKIFSKMFRAGNAVEQVPDGNGLGLYIIKSIVETVGGSIGFVSEEGQGTTFTVRLPKTGMEPRTGAKQLSLDPNLN